MDTTTWVIDAGAPTGWSRADYDGRPEHLTLRLRLAPAGDGVAVNAVQLERTDGKPLTARDLRAVKLPPDWALTGEAPSRWYDADGTPVTRHTKRPDTADRDRYVWNLWLHALAEAPHAPVRWMLPHLDISDATARRWLNRARARAEAEGWPTTQ